MRKIIGGNLFLLVFVLGVVIMGCKKDADEDIIAPEINKLTVGDDFYFLKWALVKKYGAVNTSYNIDVNLFSGNITYNATNQTYSGKGEIVYIEMYSSNANQIENGVYQLNSTKSALSFSKAWVAVNYNLSDQSSSYKSDIKSGTITVSRPKDVLTFEILLQTSDNKTIKGYMQPDPVTVVE